MAASPRGWSKSRPKPKYILTPQQVAYLVKSTDLPVKALDEDVQQQIADIVNVTNSISIPSEARSDEGLWETQISPDGSDTTSKILEEVPIPPPEETHEEPPLKYIDPKTIYKNEPLSAILNPESPKLSFQSKPVSRKKVHFETPTQSSDDASSPRLEKPRTRKRMLMANEGDALKIASIVVDTIGRRERWVEKMSISEYRNTERRWKDEIEETINAWHYHDGLYGIFKVVEVKEDGSHGDIMAAARIGFPRRMNEYKQKDLHPFLWANAASNSRKELHGQAASKSPKLGPAKRYFVDNIMQKDIYHIDFLCYGVAYSGQDTGDLVMKAVLRSADKKKKDVYLCAHRDLENKFCRDYGFVVAADGQGWCWLKRMPQTGGEGSEENQATERQGCV